MRAPRVLVLVLALALTATLASLSPSASARVDQPSPAAAAAAEVGAAERAEEIRVTSRIVKKKVRPNRPRQLVLVGAVNPPKGPVYIQRATRCNKQKTQQTQRLVCNFTFYRKVFLKKGRYQAVVDAPPRLRGWVWRAKVKSVVSEPWVTCTKRTSQDCKVPF